MNFIKLMICVITMVLLPACASTAPVVRAAPAADVPAGTPLPADPVPSALAADFAAATAEACAPVSPTDAKPVDPAACQCNQFLTTFLPNLRPLDSGEVKGPISEAEHLRILRIRLQTGDGKLKFQLACGALHMQIRDDALTAAAFITHLK